MSSNLRDLRDNGLDLITGPPVMASALEALVCCSNYFVELPALLLRSRFEGAQETDTECG
ncbi:uncharacterized protein FOMMEDRAFT_150973 [Fomitiporia mediterranea MF3/22]|uniref:uncharacterized protein n=1 Tax=Fomitiporia mediterranea (strain MF3/22) TaxID=694068 RepID=UPI000440964D|nr:uncharacterized protein FOMMEDRAFT_150973 [Fomitiporia mediterranea MF3/22]EJD08239.1 hypothetical protein FOMMEDRAFT_150973 [Fomitiporia mediterranea MF3/22]